MKQRSPADRVLCILADPDADAIDVPPDLIRDVIEKARAHGLAPVVLRKLVGRCDADYLENIRLDVEACIIMTLKLRIVTAQIGQFITEQGIKATIVKGPVFAEHLYRNSGDRPFTDLDLLCSKEARSALAIILKELGFLQAKRQFFDQSESNQEEKWTRGSSPRLMVELHGNLVHYSTLRRRISFSIDELIKIDDKNPHAPLCLFFTSVVHAALGHKFHQLRLLVDVLQSFRNLNERDRGKLADAAALLGLNLETNNCLRLIAELFGQDDAIKVAAGIKTGMTGVFASSLLSAQSVLDAPDGTPSKLRRHGFRWIQKTISR